MIALQIQLSVKFRVLFTDLYKFSHDWTLTLPLPIPLGFVDHGVLRYNDKGVTLNVGLKVLS